MTRRLFLVNHHRQAVEIGPSAYVPSSGDGIPPDRLRGEWVSVDAAMQERPCSAPMRPGDIFTVVHPHGVYR